MSKSLIPASETWLKFLAIDEGKRFIHAMPVIAWRECESDDAPPIPITAGGAMYGSKYIVDTGAGYLLVSADRKVRVTQSQKTAEAFLLEAVRS